MSELLFETDANPIPHGIKAGLLEAKGGKTLRYAILKADAKPIRGTVVLLQGRNEFIEKYFETMTDLTARGFTVDTYKEPTESSFDPVLLPWGAIASQTYAYSGTGFTKTGEEKQAPQEKSKDLGDAAQMRAAGTVA